MSSKLMLLFLLIGISLSTISAVSLTVKDDDGIEYKYTLAGTSPDGTETEAPIGLDGTVTYKDFFRQLNALFDKGAISVNVLNRHFHYDP